jgi:hypothetical protein
VVITFFCTNALANDGPSPDIYELIQDEQDISVTLRIVKGSYIGLSEKYNLVRNGPDKTVDVFRSKEFDVSQAIYNGLQCTRGRDESEACAAIPEECKGPDASELEACSDTPYFCSDCNDDGIPECPHEGSDDRWFANCEHAYFFEVIDHCVPPGTTRYAFTDNQYFLDTASIKVTKSGEKCTVPGEGDCSVAEIGAGNPAGPLTLPMIGMGIAALLFIRRRSGR